MFSGDIHTPVVYCTGFVSLEVGFDIRKIRCTAYLEIILGDCGREVETQTQVKEGSKGYVTRIFVEVNKWSVMSLLNSENHWKVCCSLQGQGNLRMCATAVI